MLSKSRVRTELFKGNRILQDRKTLSFVNFATKSVAEKNAAKYTSLVGQPVSVIPHNVNGETLWYYLSVQEYIA